MKASSICEALRVLFEAQQPTFIWGGPGIGKSAIVRQVATSLEVALQDVRALLLDPVDLRGLPFLGPDGRSKWATPDFLPTEGEGILFLDELNAAPAMVQASCYQLVLDRTLGEYTLPDGWAIVAAGNRHSAPAGRTLRELPSIEGILLNRPREPGRDQADGQYAVAPGGANCASDPNFDGMCVCLQRIPTECQVSCLRGAFLGDPSIRSTKGYVAWA